MRALAAIVLLAWLPGYAWSRVFLRQIEGVERLVLSVALSICLVTLALILGDLLLGIDVSGRSAVLYALALAAPPCVVAARRALSSRRGSPTAPARPRS